MRILRLVAGPGLAVPALRGALLDEGAVGRRDLVLVLGHRSRGVALGSGLGWVGRGPLHGLMSSAIVGAGSTERLRSRVVRWQGLSPPPWL